MRCVVVTFSVFPTHSSGREARPAVRRPGRRMRTPVHEHRPVQRPHELDVIRLHLPRQRILFLENARAAEAAPLVGGRVRPALILRSSPDRLRRGVRPLAARVVERNPEIVAKRRLCRGVRLVVLQAPFAAISGGVCGRAGCANAGALASITTAHESESTLLSHTRHPATGVCGVRPTA